MEAREEVDTEERGRFADSSEVPGERNVEVAEAAADIETIGLMEDMTSLLAE